MSRLVKITVTILMAIIIHSCSNSYEERHLPGKWEVFRVTEQFVDDQSIVGVTYHFHPDGTVEVSDTVNNYTDSSKWIFQPEITSIRLSTTKENGDSVVMACKIEFVNDTVFKMFSPKYYPTFVYFLRKLE
jgi:hypothetical protein